MKNITLCLALLMFSTITFCQGITANITVNTSDDMTHSVGGKHKITVTVRNNAAYSYVVGKSVYAVVLNYAGTTRADHVFNSISELKTTLAAGQSKTFIFDIEPPKEAGIYKVNISFNWGNRVISNVVTRNFEIEENYSVGITAEKTAFNSSGKGDIRINVANTGDISWPEGHYSLKFALVKAATGSTREEQRRFEIEPRVVETWENFEKGKKDNIVLSGFILPKTKGDYRVKVSLMLEGRLFEASGNPKEFTFKIN